jgi:hypothetical protein
VARADVRLVQANERLHEMRHLGLAGTAELLVASRARRDRAAPPQDGTEPQRRD